MTGQASEEEQIQQGAQTNDNNNNGRTESERARVVVLTADVVPTQVVNEIETGDPRSFRSPKHSMKNINLGRLGDRLPSNCSRERISGRSTPE